MMFLVSVTQLCGAIAVGLLPASAEPLEVIRAAYADQVSSIDSIEATLVRCAEQTLLRGTLTSMADSSTHWVQRGQQRRADFSRLGDGGQHSRREWYSFDGTDSRMGIWDRDTGELSSVLIERGLRRGFFAALQPGDLYGGDLLYIQETLHDLMSRPTAHVLGEDFVQGHACIMVDCGPIESATGRVEHGRSYHWRCIAWFDPAASFLPRKIRVECIRFPDATDEPQERWAEIAVDEFQTVNDPARGTRHFPRVVDFQIRARRRGGDIVEQEYRVVVESLRVNHETADEAFVLAVPPGTLILDRRTSDAGQTWTAGTPDEIDALTQKTIRGAEQELQRLLDVKAGTTVVATPQPTSLFPFFLTSGLVCVTLAAFVRWRHSRRYS